MDSGSDGMRDSLVEVPADLAEDIGVAQGGGPAEFARRQSPEALAEAASPREVREPDYRRDRSRSPRREEGDDLFVPAEADSGTGIKRETASDLEQAAKRQKPEGRLDDGANMDLSIVAKSDVLDITTGWDFSQKAHRQEVLNYISESQPKLLIGSVMCATSRGERDLKAWWESSRHFQFMTQLYRAQAMRGLWFVHAQPATATRPCAKEVRENMEEMSARFTPAAECAYHIESHTHAGQVRGTVSFFTNSGEVQERLQSPVKTRLGLDGLPAALESAIAKEAHLKRCHLRKLVTVGAHTSVAGAVPEEESDIQWKRAWDDVTGKELDPEMVQQARAQEMNYVRKKGVWRTISRAEAIRNGWKVVPTRWIDINKGDIAQPRYRSRLVAKEYNTGQQEGLFAATPPLEAVRLLISHAATAEEAPVEEEGDATKIIMVNDVARAFFEAPARRLVCVELPPEALEGEPDGADTVGLLQMSLYGTRDAASNFQAEVKAFMQAAGFTQSAYNPQVYFHSRRKIRTLVHGDDFMSTGTRASMRWFRGKLEQRFELSTTLIGPGPDEVPEERLLGRVIRAGADGSWEYEADQRHAELLIKSLNLTAAKGGEEPW